MAATRNVIIIGSGPAVKSMDVIKQGSRESSFGVADLNQMANTLSHESTLLEQELGRFTLPTPNRGGKITTATVLWQRLTFDPAHTSASALGFMSKAIHAKLVRYGEGAELIPDLAERWEVLEQGHVYRFHLRRERALPQRPAARGEGRLRDVPAAAAAGDEVERRVDLAQRDAAPLDVIEGRDAQRSAASSCATRTRSTSSSTSRWRSSSRC